MKAYFFMLVGISKERPMTRERGGLIARSKVMKEVGTDGVQCTNGVLAPEKNRASSSAGRAEDMNRDHADGLVGR